MSADVATCSAYTVKSYRAAVRHHTVVTCIRNPCCSRPYMIDDGLLAIIQLAVFRDSFCHVFVAILLTCVARKLL